MPFSAMFNTWSNINAQFMVEFEDLVKEDEFIFETSHVDVDIEFTQEEFTAEFLERVEGTTVEELAKYEGDYTVVPSTKDDISLPTKNKKTINDITVIKIPYYAVSNKTGVTVTIGDD